MHNLTVYEPKTSGKGISSGSRGGALAQGSASAAADAALVPLPSDSLSRDLSNMLSVTMDDEGFLEADDAPIVAAAPWNETLVSASTAPFIIVPQSVAGGNSFASSSYDVPVVPKETAIRALQQQRDEFGNVATEYVNYARDICQVEVAQAEANVVSDAWTHLNEKNAELNNAANIVASLRGTIGTVEQQASNEFNQNRFIKEQAVAEFTSLQESSKQSEKQNIGRLETEAQSRHETILNDRLVNEENWKAQAEIKHAAVVGDLRTQLHNTTSILRQSLGKISDLENMVKDRDANLEQAEAIVESIRESNQLMTRDFQEQQMTIQRLNAKVAHLDLQAKETDSTQDAVIQKNRALMIEVSHLKNELVKTQSALEDQQLQLAKLGSSFEDLREEFAEERQNFIDNLEQNDHTISHQLQIIKELRSTAEENQADEPVFRETLEETPKLEQPSFGQSARPQEFNIADTPPNAKAAGGNSSAPRFLAPPTSLTQESAGGNSSAKRPIPDFTQRPDGRPANYAFTRAEWIGQPKAAKEGPVPAPSQRPFFLPNSPEPDSRTPGNLSTIAPGDTSNQKATKEKINLGGWPQPKNFRKWKLSFKKAVVAATNQRPEEVFAWITAVESASSYEELGDTGPFPELDALLAADWDKILSGEFQKKVHLIEYKLESQGKMIKGRQITWMVYNHFRLSDTDSALNSWYGLMNVTLHNDNLQQFVNDWDAACEEIGGFLPDDGFMEELFRTQLEKAPCFKQHMAMYHQDVTFRGTPKSIDQLRRMVDVYLEDQLLKKNQSDHRSGAKARVVKEKPSQRTSNEKPPDKQKSKSQSGTCFKWRDTGKCVAGSSCSYSSSHTEENKNVKGGKGRGREKHRSKSDRQSSGSRQSSRSSAGGNSSARSKSSGSSGSSQDSKGRSPRDKGKDKRRRGKSPNKGKGRDDDRQPCMRFLAGKCNKEDCTFEHPKVCKFYNTKDGCSQDNCSFAHIDKEKSRAPSPSGKKRGSSRMIRFTGGTDLQQETALQDVIEKLYDRPSVKSVVARDKTCFKGTYEYASLKTPSFSSQDKAKARKDEKSPRYQPKNRYFVPHRTDANGCLTIDDEVTIEDSEHYARQSALDWARELKGLKYCHLDVDGRPGRMTLPHPTDRKPMASLSDR
jgi:hypothetical protein